MQKVRVGIIGCGRISVMHVSSALQLPQCKLVACCDKYLEKAQVYAQRHGLHAYSDYKEMIDRENLDAIHICLPHDLHVPVARYVLSKGLHVLTEKPMSIDLESAEDVVAYAATQQRLYGVILQCRYNKSAQRVKAVLDSGKLGRIISARSILTWSRPEDQYYRNSEWKGTWEHAGGGVVIDQAIHSIDLVNWLVGSRATEVSCNLASRHHKFTQVEDTAEGLITYENGVQYAFYCMNNYGCNEPIEIKLYCEHGKVTFSYDDALIAYESGETEVVHQDDSDLAIDGGKDYWGFQHIRQISQFYNACLGLEPLEISGEEALKVHRLVFSIYKNGMKHYND